MRARTPPEQGGACRAHIRSLPRRLLLAAASGLANWPVSHLPLPMAAQTLLSGGIFGALVLVPCIEARRRWVLRAIALVVGGMLIHQATLELAEHLYAPLLTVRSVIVICGAVGALLAAALTRVVAPLKAHWPLWPLSLVAGLAGGLVIASVFDTRRYGLWTACYAAWQVLVCAALYLGSTRSSDAPEQQHR